MPSACRRSLLALALAAGLVAPALQPRNAHAQAPAAGSAETAASGVIRIDSPQQGAQVWIDNELAGPVPVTRYLPAGEHTIRVAADGYDPFVRRVTIRAGTKADVAAPLSPGPGSVEFQVNAPGAKVVLDGRAESALPVRLKDVAEGEHTWRIEAPGYEPMEGTFTFRRGQNVFVYEELLSSRGRFSVRSDPEGAAVQLDGQDVGATPVDLEGIAPGLHLVRVDDGQHATVYEVVDTSDGSKGEVDARLSRRGGNVVVNTGHAEAQVLMGGVVVGEGRKVALGRLARGRYPVEVRAPGQQPAEGRLSVPARGRVSYKVDLAAEGERARSRLVELRPLHQRWTFWTAVGIGAAGATTGAVLFHQAQQPVPIPDDSDVVVTLP